MKQSTAIMLFKLFAGLSLFTGIIAVIFLTFLFITPQKKHPSPNTQTTLTPSLSPTPSGEPEGKFCGGIAAIQCPTGYTCQFDGTYPDAGGKCVKTKTN